MSWAIGPSSFSTSRRVDSRCGQERLRLAPRRVPSRPRLRGALIVLGRPRPRVRGLGGARQLAQQIVDARDVGELRAPLPGPLAQLCLQSVRFVGQGVDGLLLLGNQRAEALFLDAAPLLQAGGVADRLLAALLCLPDQVHLLGDLWRLQALLVGGAAEAEQDHVQGLLHLEEAAADARLLAATGPDPVGHRHQVGQGVEDAWGGRGRRDERQPRQRRRAGRSRCRGQPGLAGDHAHGAAGGTAGTRRGGE